jgi:spore maturation protein SpmA
MATNMIGIGNAATPAGLKVMENLENEATEKENISFKAENEKVWKDCKKQKNIKYMPKKFKKTNFQKKTKELTDEMLMFLVINTASLQIIPTNVIAIRSSLGSKNPGLIIVGVWFSSIIAFTTIVLLAKMYMFLRKNNK